MSRRMNPALLPQIPAGYIPLCLLFSCPGRRNLHFSHRFQPGATPSACFFHVPTSESCTSATDYIQVSPLLPALFMSRRQNPALLPQIPANYIQVHHLCLKQKKRHSFKDFSKLWPIFLITYRAGYSSNLLRFRILNPESLNRNSLHLLLSNRLVVPVSFCFCDFVYNIHSLSNFTESSVIAIKMR